MAARVLIVDRSPDSREVLRTLLERQGAETVEASSVGRGVDAMRHDPPDLIVLDADDVEQADDAGGRGAQSTRELAHAAAGANTPIVVLGTLGREVSGPVVGSRLAKPYHYGQLLRKIEELLGSDH